MIKPWFDFCGCTLWHIDSRECTRKELACYRRLFLVMIITQAYIVTRKACTAYCSAELSSIVFQLLTRCHNYLFLQTRLNLVKHDCHLATNVTSNTHWFSMAEPARYYLHNYHTNLNIFHLFLDATCPNLWLWNTTKPYYPVYGTCKKRVECLQVNIAIENMTIHWIIPFEKVRGLNLNVVFLMSCSGLF